MRTGVLGKATRIDPVPADHDALEGVGARDDAGAGELVLRTADGTELSLPPSMLRLVVSAARNLAAGHAVMTIAAEYGPAGIRMNMVSPGPTETGATSALSPEHIAGMNAAIPLRHRGKPEDIANAVIFFASPMSKQVTGQILGVDGGVSIQSPMPDLSGIGRR